MAATGNTSGELSPESKCTTPDSEREASGQASSTTSKPSSEDLPGDQASQDSSSTGSEDHSGDQDRRRRSAAPSPERGLGFKNFILEYILTLFRLSFLLGQDPSNTKNSTQFKKS